MTVHKRNRPVSTNRNQAQFHSLKERRSIHYAGVSTRYQISSAELFLLFTETTGLLQNDDMNSVGMNGR